MITIIWGKPRSGKTSKMAQDYVARSYSKSPFAKHYSVIYCTDPTIKGTVHIDYDDVGRFRPADNSLMLLCEAGIGLNNRQWKKLPLSRIELFAMHGHIGMDIVADSQTLDIDCSLRERVASQWLVKRLIGNLSIHYKVKFDLDVNDDTSKVEEMYSRPRGIAFLFGLLFGTVRIVSRRKSYKWFDSYYWNYEGEIPAPLPETRSRTPKEERKARRKKSA